MYSPSISSSRQIRLLLSDSMTVGNASQLKLNLIFLLAFIILFIISAYILNFIVNRCLNVYGEEIPTAIKQTKLERIEKSTGPSIKFSSELKLAGTEPICAICLSEFIDGEEIRVLSKCNHGFHVKCIENWLLSSDHVSCPTCRTNCMMSTASTSTSTASSSSGNGSYDDNRVDLESGSVLLQSGAEKK